MPAVTPPPTAPREQTPSPPTPPFSWWRALLKALWDTGNAMLQRDASLIAAGLAFFALLSLAPFIVLAVAMGGVLFGRQVAEKEISQRVADELGEGVAGFVTELAENASDIQSLSIATLVSSVILLWSSTRLFMEVRRALHALWGVVANDGLSIRGILLGHLKARLLSSLGTLVLGAALLGLVVSRYILRYLSIHEFGWAVGLWGWFEPLITLFVLSTLIVMVFKFLPEKGPSGWPLWLGAGISALLFVAARGLVMLYVSALAINTAYGAAGSAIVFLIWAYASSLAFLFGARFAWAVDTLRRERLGAMSAG